MRIVVFLALLFCSVSVARGFEDASLEDDDFAEFEQFEVNEEKEPKFPKKEDEEPKVNIKKDKYDANDNEDDIVVEDEEFEHFQDPEEFEGFPETAPRSAEQPKITISKVPIVVHARWDAYWLEGILCCLLATYALVYAVGRAKNTSIAINFLKLHRPLLEDNFTLVGESGLEMVPEERGWRREAEHCFTMWCSGRQCCEGMLLALKLIKRQDLVNVLLGVVRPSPDTLQIRVELSKDDNDPFVLCIAQKKTATRLSKEMQDLSMFCPERRPGDKHGLPSSLSVMSECAEATGALLDARVVAALHQYAAHVQYIHVSDKYCGAKQLEETVSTKPPETERVLLASLALSGEGGGEEVRPLLLMIFYMLDRIKRLRLSKEALSKCEKRRLKATEVWMKGVHAARQESAALRREEKRKQEKEKILAEDDPEKQRRWELKEQKRQQKRKAPKLKQLKVKAL